MKNTSLKIKTDFSFSDLVDVAELQQLVNHLSELSGLAVGVTDSNNNILVTCGWKKICSVFHCVHPVASVNCIRSKKFAQQHLVNDSPISLRCNNRLNDNFYPIFIENKYVAGIYIGQYLYDGEKIDIQHFTKQAEKYGFDKKEYLACLNEIPFIVHEKMEIFKNLALTLAQMLAKMGYSNLLLKKEKVEELKLANEIIKLSEEKFKTIFSQSPIGLEIYNKEGKLLDCNPACLSMFGIDNIKEVVGFNLFDNPNLSEDQKKAIKGGEDVHFEVKFDFDLVKKLNLYTTSKSGISYLSCFATTLKIRGEKKTGFLLHLIDITKRKNEELLLQEENNRFSATMNAMDAVVYVADIENHEILFVNRYVENVFGNIKGEKCYAALQGKTAPCDFCTNHLLLDANGNINPPYVWEFQNELTKRWYQCHDQGLQWTNNKIVRFETAADITKNKEIEEKLRIDELKLVELNATKDKFFSIIAHDLRNPFTVLRNSSYLLTKHIENNDITKSLEKAKMISNSVKNAYTLLENLLIWSKSQTGGIKVEMKDFNLRNRVELNIKEIENHANQKEINLINKIPDHLTIEADENLLSEIFRNLITNAIKFTNNGGKVIIKAKLDGELIETAVIDNGIGIPKEHQHRLFKLDDNYSRVGTAKESSTGLGLILCKEFIEKHNGLIWFESEVGKGSTFKFTLPYKQQKRN